MMMTSRWALILLKIADSSTRWDRRTGQDNVELPKYFQVQLKAIWLILEISAS